MWSAFLTPPRARKPIIAQDIHSSKGLAHDRQYLEMKNNSKKKKQIISRIHRHAQKKKQDIYKS